MQFLHMSIYTELMSVALQDKKLRLTVFAGLHVELIHNQSENIVPVLNVLPEAYFLAALNPQIYHFHIHLVTGHEMAPILHISLITFLFRDPQPWETRLFARLTARVPIGSPPL